MKLKSGIYYATGADFLSRYKVVMEVKETEKSYVFHLLKLINNWGQADLIKMLFDGKKSKTAFLRKDKGGHAIRKWSEEDFTLYPFQEGVPFWFRRIEADQLDQVI